VLVNVGVRGRSGHQTSLRPYPPVTHLTSSKLPRGALLSARITACGDQTKSDPALRAPRQSHLRCARIRPALLITETLETAPPRSLPLVLFLTHRRSDNRRPAGIDLRIGNPVLPLRQPLTFASSKSSRREPSYGPKLLRKRSFPPSRASFHRGSRQYRAPSSGRSSATACKRPQGEQLCSDTGRCLLCWAFLHSKRRPSWIPRGLQEELRLFWHCCLRVRLLYPRGRANKVTIRRSSKPDASHPNKRGRKTLTDLINAQRPRAR
jgi:hypothetical protein